MERVSLSAQRMLFPTQEFAMYGDFYWSHHRICHHFLNIWRLILMTLN